VNINVWQFDVNVNVNMNVIRVIQRHQGKNLFAFSRIGFACRRTPAN
jgi:hypothetical protein